MKRISIVVLTLVLAACGGGAQESSTPQPANNPAPVAGPVVFVGDSITAYWESGPFTTPDPKLSQLVPGSVNAGIPGNRTDQMLARFQDVIDKHPSVVVILGGTNDIRQVEFPTTDSIAAMADKAAASGARVIICTVPPASQTLLSTAVSGYSDTTNDAHIRKFNSDLRTLAAGFGYPVVDYYPALTNADGSQNVTLYVSGDLIHPNAVGYRVMWPILRRQLVQLGVQNISP